MPIGRNNKAVLTGQRAWIRHPGRADATAFVALARRSRRFHRPWVLRYAFSELRLHRLEANVQPGDVASLALVQRLGFHLEGLSPRYLKVGGRWQDHQRWAVLSDQGNPESR